MASEGYSNDYLKLMINVLILVLVEDGFREGGFLY